MREPVASPGLLIRQPISKIFEAFIDPQITSRFWFSSGSGRLDNNTTVEWTWGMYGFSTPVRVLAVEVPNRISVEWGEGNDKTEVEWTFKALTRDQTFVSISHSGFHGSDQEKMAAALDGMNGFSLVLAGAKIWLEHGIEPRFVLDRHPSMRVAGWERFEHSPARSI